MSQSMLPSVEALAQLKSEHYNARVERMLRQSDDLMILRVVSDAVPPKPVAGQYTTLGLGTWEPRIAGLPVEEHKPGDQARIIKRAYSLSCSLDITQGRPPLVSEYPYLEFYVSLARPSHPGAPTLTPRLFRLTEGSRLWCGEHFHGHYTLGRIDPDKNILLAATGTGEAPHNAMLAELLARGHRGRIVSAMCVRFRSDLAYLDAHRRLEREFSNYRYLTMTTRESENLDPSAAGYVGKRHLQDYLDSGDLERDAGVSLTPEKSHVFLCGNPQMIGVPHHTHDPSRRYPVPRGMVEVLEHRGFAVDRPHEPGNVHFEKYW